MTGAPAGTPTVLLVEDSPDDVLLVRRAFRKAGVCVSLQSVHDGDEALHYLLGEGAYADRQRHPLPALVVLDWKLPRRSGLEVLQWVRAQAAFDGLPVVVLTTSNEQEDVRQAYEARVNSFLQKPVTFDALTERVGLLAAYWLQHNIGQVAP